MPQRFALTVMEIERATNPMCSRITRVRFVGKFMEIIRFQLHHLHVVENLHLESRLATFTWLDTVEFDLSGFERNTDGKSIWAYII